MIISNSHNFIFVHILKTAGTSICAALDPTLRWNDVILGGTVFGEQVNGPYKDRFGLLKHATARQIRAVVGEDVWASFFTFAVVRHPYTRMVSFYTWLEKSIQKAGPEAAIWTWPSTKGFVESKTFSEFIRNEKFLHAMASHPQGDWVCDDQGRCIVDYVGRFEDLSSVRAMISDRIGVDLVPLARHNPSAGPKPLAEFFSGEADYVYLHKLHEKDFELFGYDPSLRF